MVRRSSRFGALRGLGRVRRRGLTGRFIGFLPKNWENLGENLKNLSFLKIFAIFKVEKITFATPVHEYTHFVDGKVKSALRQLEYTRTCLLYTSDAADE